MRTTAGLAVAFAAFITASTGAHAQDCPVAEGTDAWELDDAAVIELYDCIKDSAGRRLRQGVATKPHRVPSIAAWTATSARPRRGIEGSHGERFLLTFANDIAADAVS